MPSVRYLPPSIRATSISHSFTIRFLCIMRTSSLFLGSTAGLLCLAALCSLAIAQIVGCDSLDCAQGSSDDNTLTCPLSSDGVGTTIFQSNVTTDGPLTWSLIGDTDRFTTQQAPKNAKRIIKSFFFGTPSSLLLQDPDFHGCSFMFFNITSALQTVPGYSDFPHFGCDTVLGEQCANDLQQQARQELTDRVAANGPDPFCDNIRKVLQASMPDSCRLPFGRTSWGNINEAGKPYPILSHLICSTLLLTLFCQASLASIEAHTYQSRRENATSQVKALNTISSERTTSPMNSTLTRRKPPSGATVPHP